MATYTEIRDGLHAVVATVEDIKGPLDYEPASIDVRNLAWILLDSYTRPQSRGQVTTMRYRFVVRVATPIQNSKEAEDELIEAALEVANAVDTDPQFSGTLVSGLAASPDGQTGWIMLAGVKCRVVDVFVEVVAKEAYRGAIV